MQKTLIILLHLEDLAHPSWILHGGEFSEQVYKGNPDALKDLADGRQVILIVPGEDVLLTSSKLPKLSKSRLSQALPYALEEQVIPEVESLHFAAGEYQPDNELPVAIVAKEKMQQWIELLQSWDVMADQFIAEFFCLPVEENCWQVVVTNKIIIRITEYKALTCDPESIHEICQLLLAQSHVTPQNFYINYYESQNKLKLNTPFPVTEQVFPSKQIIEDFARSVLQTPHINLLQGQFATKKSKFPERGRLIQFMAGLAVAWAILIFSYPTVSYFFLHHKVRELDARIADIYKQNFPQSTSVVAPKLRMEEKLKSLSNNKNASRLLHLLAFVAKDLETSPNVSIKRFDFQNNQLNLEVSALSSEDFSLFTENLQKQGLSVQQQNANVVDTKINATVLIE